MKTHRLLTLIAAALLCAASPQPSPAADVVVDISSFAPREPSVIQRQIELNVAIKQYEKVLMELHEASLQSEIGPTETGLTDEQQKLWMVRAQRRFKFLDDTVKNLEARIQHLVREANDMARDLEKAKAGKETKPHAAPSQPKAEPLG